MIIEKFTYHFELAPTINFQKATVGMTVECILEAGDDPVVEKARIRSEVRKEVGQEALKAIDDLQIAINNRKRDIG